MPGLRLDIETSSAKRNLNKALQEMRAAASVPIKTRLTVDTSAIKRARKEIDALRREMVNSLGAKALDAGVGKTKPKQSGQSAVTDRNIKAARQQVKNTKSLTIDLQKEERTMNKRIESFEKTMSKYGLLHDPKYSKILEEANAFAEKIRGETSSVKSKEALGLPVDLKSYYDNIIKESKQFVSDMAVMQSRIEKSINFNGLGNNISKANEKLVRATADYNKLIQENGNKLSGSESERLRRKMQAVSEYQTKIADAQKALDDPFSIDRDKETYFNRLSSDADKAASKVINDVKKIEDYLKSVESQDKNMRAFDKLGNRLTSYFKQYGTQITKNQELFDKFNTLMFKLNNGQFASSTEANNAFASFRMDARRAGVEIDTLGAKLERTFGARLRSLVAGEGVMMISTALRDIVQNAIDVDTAMTELKKVTDASDSTYIKFLDNASNRAQNLGTTLVDVVSSTADFARLGYSIQEATQLADSALLYSNIGDGVADITESTESIISTMQGLIYKSPYMVTYR